MKPAIRQKIPFGEWRPDRAAIEGQGLVKARNVLPVSGAYVPAKSLNPISTNALDYHGRGVFAARDYAASPVISYGFAGDKAKLYRLSGTSFSNVSKAGLPGAGYNLQADNRWEFVKYDRGRLVVAAAIDYAPQKWTLGTSSAFADLGGTSTAGNGGTQLKFRHLCVWGGYLIGGYTVEDQTYPNKVRWSALNNAEDWTINPAGTGADEQILSDAMGDIRKVVSSEQAWFALCEQSIHRADYIGGEFVFQFNRLTDRAGAFASGSVIQVGGVIYFLDRSGFYACDGSRVESLGHDKVDRYFLTESADLFRLDRMSVAHDPDQKLIFWLYVSVDNQNLDPYPDRMLVYNYLENRFSEIRLSADTDFIGDFLSQPTTLDDLAGTEVDDLNISVDDASWHGGFHRLAAFDASHELNYPTGPSLAATFETPEIELAEGQRSMIRRARPLVERITDSTGNPTDCLVAVGARNNQRDAEAFGAAVAQEAQGHVPLSGASSVGRYHRFQVTTPPGTDFTRAVGLEIEAVPMGRR
ncbi:MAG: hypothetical protein AB1405_07805 [Bdellovibrionota bacterium]